MTAKVNEYKEEVAKQEDNRAMLLKRLSNLEATQSRHRIYLLSRISDYSKELGFWRDTARKIVTGGGLDRNSTEAFLQNITASLGTYGAKERDYEFNDILNAARLLTKPEDGGGGE
jgi:hypothetical protein